MKKIKRTPLTLTTQTIRDLSPAQLRRAAGGNLADRGPIGPHGSVYECATGWCTSNYPTYCLTCGCTIVTSAVAC